MGQRPSVMKIEAPPTIEKPHPIDLVLSSSQGGDKDRPTFIIDPPVENVVGYTVNYVIIPFSYYVVDDTNNKITLHQRVPRGDLSVTGSPEYIWFMFDLTLRPGSYSADNFKNEWSRVLQQTQTTKYWYLNPLDSNAYTLGTLVTPAYPSEPTKFVFFVEPESGRSIFYHTTTPFDIYFTNSFNVFGHRDNTKKSSVLEPVFRDGVAVEAGSPVNVVRSPRVVRLIGPSMVNLHSDLPFDANSRNARQSTPTLLRMPVSGNFGTYMTYVGNGEMIPCSIPKINTAEFWLTLTGRTDYPAYDSDYSVPAVKEWTNYLRLNGEEFSLSLRLYTDKGTQYAY